MHPTTIKTGYSCNNNCIHCVIADNKESLMVRGLPINRSTIEYKKELYASKLSGFDNVSFTGGEPTIRKDIIELLSYAKKLGYTTSLQTTQFHNPGQQLFPGNNQGYQEPYFIGGKRLWQTRHLKEKLQIPQRHICFHDCFGHKKNELCFPPCQGQCP